MLRVLDPLGRDPERLVLRLEVISIAVNIIIVILNLLRLCQPRGGGAAPFHHLTLAPPSALHDPESVVVVEVSSSSLFSPFLTFASRQRLIELGLCLTDCSSENERRSAARGQKRGNGRATTTFPAAASCSVKTSDFKRGPGFVNSFLKLRDGNAQPKVLNI